MQGRGSKSSLIKPLQIFWIPQFRALCPISASLSPLSPFLCVRSLYPSLSPLMKALIGHSVSWLGLRWKTVISQSVFDFVVCGSSLIRDTNRFNIHRRVWNKKEPFGTLKKTPWTKFGSWREVFFSNSWDVCLDIALVEGSSLSILVEFICYPHPTFLRSFRLETKRAISGKIHRSTFPL